MTFIAFAGTLAMTASPGRAASVDDATQKLLTSNYSLRCTAAFNPSDANLDAAFGLLAPEFVGIDPKGREVSRDEVIGVAKQELKMLHATTCDDKIESFTLSDPNTVIVANSFHLEGDLAAPDGKHTLELSETSSDTWKNQNGKWLTAQRKDSSLLVKIDGNVVQDDNS